jgi:pimeloyl-ACP methyl ester carboxylesterase
VEALRAHLRQDRVDVLGHSAGGTLAVLYAAVHPDHVGRLALVNPSPRVVGLEISDSDRRQVAELRAPEPWFPDAFAGFERIWSAQSTEADWTAIEPFMHGRWDAERQAMATEWSTQKDPDAAAIYYQPGCPAPEAVTAALTRLQAPVLLVRGEYDVGLPPHRAAEYATLFNNAELVVQPRSGHYPWLDDPEWFVGSLDAFLR